ncbi:MAG: protein NO VEIN domain-containing protein [Actinomycetales bacterium]
MTVQGETVKNPTKEALAADVAAALGIPAPPVSRGSSVASSFLSAISTARGGPDLQGLDAYRKTERVLQLLGLDYDPWWDTSESTPTGGSTVTNRAYSRIRSAITERPRCFILNTSSPTLGMNDLAQMQQIYTYSTASNGYHALNDGGPGSRVLFYATGSSPAKSHSFVAAATIDYIRSGWTGPWEARLTGYRLLSPNVPLDQVQIAGWNQRHSIVEITAETFDAILARGSVLSGLEASPWDEPNLSMGLAERVIESFPSPTGGGAFVGLADQVPDMLPLGVLTPAPVFQTAYEEEEEGWKGIGTQEKSKSGAKKRQLDRLTEQRAVELVKNFLSADDWVLVRDNQLDGVGFDLTFSKEERSLHVEVKGIRAPTIAFNITPKEWWRCLTDSDFVVFAVTEVLSPANFYIHILGRDKLVALPRLITGYRLSTEPTSEISDL